jgi:hypothetical protein
MTCPACARPIPETELACPVCVMENNRRALREFQYAPLRQVIAGRARLTTRRVGGARHLQMFGAMRTFCGLGISPQHGRSWVEWDPAELNRICDECRAQAHEIAEEVRRMA